MRTNGTLNFLLGDHLGSTSLVTDSAGNKINEQRYKAWGETRYAFGNSPTKYQYTGQFSYESDFGLYFYNARWYDSSLGRFAQADSIIPQNQGVQAWDRYAYSNNNPVKYTDPSGHFTCQNNSTAFEGDCQAVIEAYLTLLQEKGGKEGQALVDAFRVADTIAIHGRGGGYVLEDQISINIVEGDGNAGYLGGSDFSITAGLLNNSGEIDRLVNVGQFGHEIVHLTQDDLMDRLLGISSGSLHDEMDAYDVQSKIYKNMGLTTGDHSTIAYAAEVASYKDKSAEEILSSNWAKAKDQYSTFPLFSGGNRGFDNFWYLELPKRLDSPYIRPRGIPR